MFCRVLCSSRALTTKTLVCNNPWHSSTLTKTHLKKRQNCDFNNQEIFPLSQIKNPRSMASQGERFPPQRQERQPGKENVMDPTPQFSAPEYKPSNKLQVLLYI